MKSGLENIEKNKVALEIEVDTETLEAALDRAYRKVVKKVNIPGFRKGRAPRQIVEAYVGYEALLDEALEEVVSEAYEAAVAEQGIEPVAQPQLDIVSAKKGEPLVFKAVVAVKPEVELGEYKGLTVTVPRIEVTDESVENRLETLRKRYARLEKVEDDTPAEIGDTVLIDFEGFVDGIPFEGGKGEDYSLELGSRTFIPGFEEQLAGARTGEDVEVNVVFPENYHAEDLAGKPAVFKVHVKEIKKRILSDLNDEFAQEVSDFSTLDELKQDIRKNLEEIVEQRKKQVATDEAIQKVIENSTIDIPEEMVNTRAYELLEQMAERMAYQGVSIDDYLRQTGTTVEALHAAFKVDAEGIIRRELVLEAIARKENLSISEEDYESSLKSTADSYGMNVDEVRNRLEGQRKRIEEGILLDKASQFLYENARIEVETPGEATEEKTAE